MNSSTTKGQYTEILSYEDYVFASRILNPTCLILAVIGVITNAINIRVFVEQGVKSSNTNIGLLALSVFDLITAFLMSLTFSCEIFSYIRDVRGYIICQTFSNYAIFYSFSFSHCSTSTTVFLSLERTLCVVMPLKVKLFFRPKKTIITIICMPIFFSILQLLYTASTEIRWWYDSGLNASLPYLHEKTNANLFLRISAALTDSALNSLAIIVVAINTTIMIYKLNQFKKWRDANLHTSSGQIGDGSQATKETGKPKQSTASSSMSSRDAELVKSVTAVTSVFLVCLSMSHIPATAILALPGVSFSGVNINLMRLVFSIRIAFLLINSSVNFFFYLRVSSRYKEAFGRVFARCSKGE